ncbi:hypothetical protein [Nocardioides sp.]|uniref:hypothetical protein n=1 Tax=Nocardioides sp. TaxID=35761 RepID=UPI0035644FA0
MTGPLEHPLDHPDGRPAGRPAGRSVRHAAIVLAAMALAAVVAGLVWEWWWTPPTGYVVDHQWYADGAGLREDFSGTGTYVAVASLTGLLVAVTLAVVFDRSELAVLGGVVVGSVLAAWLMHRVGLAVAPPDPAVAAATAEDGTTLPGALEVVGFSPFLAFPVGSSVGLLVVFFGLARRERSADRPTGHE